MPQSHKNHVDCLCGNHMYIHAYFWEFYLCPMCVQHQADGHYKRPTVQPSTPMLKATSVESYYFFGKWGWVSPAQVATQIWGLYIVLLCHWLFPIQDLYLLMTLMSLQKPNKFLLAHLSPVDLSFCFIHERPRCSCLHRIILYNIYYISYKLFLFTYLTFYANIVWLAVYVELVIRIGDMGQYHAMHFRLENA